MLKHLLLALATLCVGAAAQYPPEYQPKQPYGAPEPPKTISGSFLCAVHPVTGVRGREYEIAPVVVPESAATFRFLLRPDATWVDLSRPNQPVAGKVTYRNGLAHLVDGRGAILYSYAWRKDARGNEYLVRLGARGASAYVCRKVK